MIETFRYRFARRDHRAATRSHRLKIAMWMLSVAVTGAAAFGQSPQDAGADEVIVRVDSRVELVSIVFRLAGHPEYNQGRLEKYNRDIDAQFGPHRDHPAVAMARRLRGTRGVSYDACMSFAIHFDDTGSFQPLVPFDAPNITLDDRWTPDAAAEFLIKLQDFATVTDFDDFIRDHEALYAEAAQRMRTLLDRSADLEWFEQFFGVAPQAPFTLAIGLVNGPANYGPKFVEPDGTEHLYAIIGVWLADGEGVPFFNDRFIGTIVHEFSHSFANPLIEARRDELRAAGETMYAPLAGAMERQAYGNWETMLKESLVRASVVRYIHDHDGEDAARREIARQEEERSFLWTGDLAALLGTYDAQQEKYRTLAAFMPRIVEFFNETAPTVARRDAQREKYRTLAAFMPRIVEFFNETAPTVAKRIAQREVDQNANRPQVASIVPAHGAQAVDPGLTAIVITFDRPMAGGYSVMIDPSGRRHFPEVVESGWDETRTAFTLQVKLKPDWTYRFALNHEGGGAFRSADGVPLTRTPITFTTGTARP